jgi:hypothetical protein
MKALSNIRAIRSMQFSLAAERALAMCLRGALVEGSTHGMVRAFIYVAEAMLFYVGATLVARGKLEVLNLVVFTVTVGSQLLSCSMSYPPPLRFPFSNPFSIFFLVKPKGLLNLFKPRGISTIF